MYFRVLKIAIWKSEWYPRIFLVSGNQVDFQPGLCDYYALPVPSFSRLVRQRRLRKRKCLTRDDRHYLKLNPSHSGGFKREMVQDPRDYILTFLKAAEKFRAFHWIKYFKFPFFIFKNIKIQNYCIWIITTFLQKYKPFLYKIMKK